MKNEDLTIKAYAKNALIMFHDMGDKSRISDKSVIIDYFSRSAKVFQKIS